MIGVLCLFVTDLLCFVVCRVLCCLGYGLFGLVFGLCLVCILLWLGLCFVWDLVVG